MSCQTTASSIWLRFMHCGEPPQPVLSAASTRGFRLVSDRDRADSLPVALAVEPPIERLPRLAESAVAAATRPAGTETSVVVIV